MNKSHKMQKATRTVTQPVGTTASKHWGQCKALTARRLVYAVGFVALYLLLEIGRAHV